MDRCIVLLKQRFLLCHVRPFCSWLRLPIDPIDNVVVAVDLLALQKKVDDQNSVHVPKYNDLACWLLCLRTLWPAFPLSSWLSWRSFGLWWKVMNPCYRVNSFKQRSESWIRCCFCSTVNKRGTYLEYNSFILKFSCTTLNTVPFDIFRMSAISCNFTKWQNDFQDFFCVFGSSHLSLTTWTLRIFGVCSTAFQTCKPSANGCFRSGIFPVTLSKPLLSLNGIFTH